MSINFKKFVPRPGLVNKQGRLPDPTELVCIEVPKMFDQCLIKRCISYGDGRDTNSTDCELRSNPLTNPNRYISSRDFDIKLLSVEKVPFRGKSDFKKIILNYMISFCADYVDCDGVTQTELYEINRTDIIGKFYCPDAIAQVSDTTRSCQNSNDPESNIIRLEMVADALDGQLSCLCDGSWVLDITLGYYIVVRSELTVQLLVPAYDYCPVPKERYEEEEADEDPCERFNRAPVPKFFPKQNLKPLFPDSDCYDSDSVTDFDMDMDVDMDEYDEYDDDIDFGIFESEDGM